MNEILVAVGLIGGAFAWMYAVLDKLDTRMDALEKQFLTLSTRLEFHIEESGRSVNQLYCLVSEVKRELRDKRS